MKTTMPILVAAAALLSTTAIAYADAADDVIRQLSEQGYTRIEIKRGLARIKIEAENADGEPPFFINETVLQHDEVGPFVWKADGLSIADLDRSYDPHRQIA